jgi:hypothetical protein
MHTSKRSSTPAKNGSDGPNRQSGIDHYESLITLEKSNEKQDTILIRRYEAIIECLKKRMKSEKKK